jgi:integrase
MKRQQRQRRSWGKIRQLRHGSGNFQASYIGPDLARHNAPGTFVSRMDAEHWLADERRLIDRDEWTPPAQRVAEKRARSITVREYASDWIKTRTLKDRTRIGYERHLELYIYPKLGHLTLDSITPELVRTWHAGLGKDAPRRNSHVYGLLHAVLATAVTDGRLNANPCNLKKVMNVATKRAAVILDVDEVAKLAIAIEPQRFRALVLILAWCGPRWGEAIELRRSDFNADCSTVSIARAVTHRGECRISTTKTGNRRTVAVPRHIRQDLLDHINTYVGKESDALLFPAVTSASRCGHLDDKTFGDRFRAALKSVGHEGVRIHDMRHFAGTQAARVGNLTETMQRLGHSTAKASLIYQSVVSGRDAELAEELSRLAEKVAGAG